jgi:hypothetical protein
MNKIKKIFFVIIILSFINCKDNLNSNKLLKNQKLNNSKNLFQNKLKSETKIFLKYWSDMTKEDFDKVNDLLLKENIIKTNGTIEYLMGKQSLYLRSFNFSDNYENSFKLSEINRNKNYNTIDGIQLYGFDIETYNLFREKYSLPEYVLENSATFILEENPFYDNPNAEENEIGKKIEILEINEVKNIFEKNLYPEWEIVGYVPEIEQITLEKEIIIKEKEKVVIFKVNKDIEARVGGVYNGCWYYYRNNDKKDRLRIVAIPNNSYLTVTYLSKDKYETINEVGKIKNEKNLLEKNKEKEKEKIREKDFKGEI